MILTELVKRLRDTCPLLGRRVGGTAAFSRAMYESADITLPMAFVSPIGTSAARPEGNMTAQVLTERFAIIVCVSNDVNTRHGAGLVASDAVVAVRQELFTAFLGWEPTMWRTGTPTATITEPWLQEMIPNSRASRVRFVRSSHIDMNQRQLWHQFEFEVDYTVDTLQPVSVDALIEQIYLGWAPQVGDLGGAVEDYELLVDFDNTEGVYREGSYTPDPSSDASKFFKATKASGVQS